MAKKGYKFDLISATRMLALEAVRERPPEYEYRKICRWYSATFATPLSEVEALPIEDVLQHYWEDQFENLEADRMDEVQREVLLLPAERAARDEKARREEQEDDEFLAQVRREEALKQLSTAHNVKGEPVKDEEPEPFVPAVPVMGEAHPVASFSGTDEIPPDVEIRFVDEELNLDEWDVTADPRRDDK